MNETFKIFFPNLILLLTYIFLILEKIPRVVVALLGASAVIIAKCITQEEAFHHVDFNVIFLLVGMMILVNVLNQTGGLKWLAIYLARNVNGSGIRLLIYMALLTAFLSAFLDNVTTVILLGTVTCSLAKILKINPVPYLVTEIISSNIGGTATLIGDPPNIMIGSAVKLTFNDFIFNLAPVVLLILPVAIFTLYLIYKNSLNISKESISELEKINLNEIISDKSLLIKTIIVILLVIIGFFLHGLFELEAGTIAMAGAAVLMIFENKKDIWDDVEWTTVFFFIGLFIIVGAVEKAGTITYLSELVFKLSNGDFKFLTITILWVSAILSAAIDNIPYTATMIPLIESMGQHFNNTEPLYWSLALGACLGGNGTLIGASANIIVADLSNKENHPIKFFEFLKIGGLITLESIIISNIYIWCRYLN